MKKYFGKKLLGERSMFGRLLGRRQPVQNLNQKLSGRIASQRQLGGTKILLIMSLVVATLAGGLITQIIKNYQATAYSADQFVTRWTNLPAGELAINLHGTNNSIHVSWGDGSNNTYTNVSQISHNYAAGGTYDITIQTTSGVFNGWTLRNNTKAQYLTHVLHWGNSVSFTNMSSMFAGAANLNSLPTTAPNTANVTDMSYMFDGATSFNQPVNFNTASVKNMNYMFHKASSFNQPVNFNTSNVESMNYMFYEASAFDQDVSGFDFSKLPDGYKMIYFVSYSGLSVPNYDNLITKWRNTLYYKFMSAVVGSHGLSYCTTKTAHDELVAKNWAFNDSYDCNADAFRTRWTNLPAGMLTINLHGNDNTFRVDWGDGTVETLTNVTSMSHNYTTTATREIAITATGSNKFNGWNLYNNTKAQYLTHVLRWGRVAFTNMSYMFRGASSLNSLPTTTPNTANVTDMSYMFDGATSFNQPVNFNTSKVTDMSYMFAGATSFNQPVNFNTASVNSIRSMFNGAAAFNQDISHFDFSKLTGAFSLMDFVSNTALSVSNYDALLKKWHTQFTDSAAMHRPRSTGLRYCTAEAEHDFLKNTKGWTFEDARYCPFTTRWTGLFKGELTISLHGNDNTFTIDWGDGTVETLTNVSQMSHTYAAHGTYDISISTDADGQRFNGWTLLDNHDPNVNSTRLTHVLSWGSVAFTNMSKMFYNAQKLSSFPSTAPNTSNVTDMSFMFGWAFSFNQPVNFDTSRVTDMSDMFRGATSFNQPVNFDTSKVVSMNGMFNHAKAFNQPVNFNTSKVTDMSDMFRGATSFNQPVNFDTSKVVSMISMFSNATAFNQPLNFDTSSVIDMSSMFSNTTSFNQPLNFDTSKVGSMNSMFSNATAFNQPLNFNTTKVINMRNVFHNAISFNQDLSGFDFSQVGIDYYGSTLDLFVSGSGLSTENYDKLLKKWHTQFAGSSVAHTPKSTGLKYCTAETERNYLKNTKNWKFEDSKDPDCVIVNVAPADIALSNDQLDENNVPNFELADITITNDPNDLTGDTNTPSLTCAVAGADDASFQIAGNKLVLQPSANFEAKNSYAICLRATDAGGLTLDKNFTISVRDVNETPVIADQAFNVAENSANGTELGQVTASDPDTGQTLTYTIIGGNDLGIFAISSDGKLTVADNANLNHEAHQSMVLRVRVADDGNPALQAEADMTVTITDVNDAPTISGTPAAGVDQDATYSFTPVVNDPDGSAPNNTLTFSIDNKPSWLNFDTNTGALTGTPTNAEVGNYENIVIRVSDGGGLSAALPAFNITVNNVNDAPNLADRTVAVAENSAIGTEVVQLVATDIDTGQGLSYEIIGGNDLGIFALSADGKLTIANNANLNYEQHQSVNLQVRATDNGTPALSDDATITVDITDANDAPVITSSAAQAATKGEQYGYTITATDEDGNGLTYAATVLPNWLSFDAGTRVLSGTPGNAETNNDYSVTLTVNDGTVTVEQSFTIHVNDKNYAPVIADQPFTIAENSANGTEVGQVVATDSDAGQTLTYNIVGGNDLNIFALSAGGRLTIADNTNLNHEARQSVVLRVRVSDDGSPAGSAEANVTVAITDVNEAPTISGTPATSVDQVQAYSFTPSSSDPDTTAPNNNLTFAIENKPSWANFDTNTGALTGTPANEHVGVHENIVIRVTDGGSLSASLPAFNITVNNVNDAPVITDQAFSVAENSASGTVVGQVTASDIDAGQNLNYEIVNGNSLGMFALSANGQLTVADNSRLDFEDVVQVVLRVRVSDSGTPAMSAEADVTVNVTDVNEAPSFTSNATVSLAHDEVLAHNLSATDPENDALTYSVTSLPAWMNLAGDTLTLTPTAAQIGEHDVTVKVNDGVNEASQTIHVTVREANIAPVMTDQTFSINENSINGTLVGTLVATDANANDSLNFTIVSGNELGIFALGSDGKLTIANNANLDHEARTSVTLRVRVSDNGTPAMNAEANAVINIADVDDEAPTITLSATDPITIKEGEDFTLPTADCHDNQSSCTMTITNPVDVNAPGVYQIVYKAVDAAGNQTIAQVQVTVKAKMVVPNQPTIPFTPTNPTSPVTPMTPRLTTPRRPSVTTTPAAEEKSNSAPFTLKHSREIVLNLNETYHEPGVECAESTNCTVEITGRVDTSRAGTYTITYRLANGDYTLTRTVIVRDPAAANADTNQSQSADSANKNWWQDVLSFTINFWWLWLIVISLWWLIIFWRRRKKEEHEVNLPPRRRHKG